MDDIDQIVVDEAKPRLVQAQNGPLAYWCNKAYGKDPNQDRQYLHTAANIFLSCDGLGGREHGDLVAHLFAEHVQNAVYRDNWVTPQSMGWVHEQVHARLNERNINGGTCYLLFGIQGNQLHVYHAGDVKLIVLDETGTKVFETEDHVETITEYFWEKRQIVTNSVSHSRLGRVVLDTLPLQTGYRIIAASDGLWKPYPVPQAIALTRGKAPLAALECIANGELFLRDNLNLFVYDLITFSVPQPL